MSRKRNIKKEMFQPTTECIDSLAIDDIANQNANLNTAVG